MMDLAGGARSRSSDPAGGGQQAVLPGASKHAIITRRKREKEKTEGAPNSRALRRPSWMPDSRRGSARQSQGTEKPGTAASAALRSGIVGVSFEATPGRAQGGPPGPALFAEWRLRWLPQSLASSSSWRLRCKRTPRR